MIKILLVEDELIIAEYMTILLEKMGYTITGSALDYEEAIELLQTEKPDLILLDINLGGELDGLDLAEEINRSFEIPFIFTTSHSDTVTLERVKKVAPANYLVKPFQPEQLYTAIEIAMFNISRQGEQPTSKIDNDQSFSDGLFIKDTLFIKEKFKYTKLAISDILWIKAEGNYLEIHLAERRELIRASLSAFLERLNRPNFFRTHKSYAVNLDYLTRFEPAIVTILETPIPISKTYSEGLLKLLEVL